jgi:hypothetical protein
MTIFGVFKGSQESIRNQRTVSVLRQDEKEKKSGQILPKPSDKKKNNIPRLAGQSKQINSSIDQIRKKPSTKTDNLDERAKFLQLRARFKEINDIAARQADVEWSQKIIPTDGSV